MDENGHTVTIRGTDGTAYVSGDSQYTVTVSAYDEDADLFGAGTVTTFEDAQVNTGSRPPVVWAAVRRLNCHKAAWTTAAPRLRRYRKPTGTPKAIPDAPDNSFSF